MCPMVCYLLKKVNLFLLNRDMVSRMPLSVVVIYKPILNDCFFKFFFRMQRHFYLNVVWR